MSGSPESSASVAAVSVAICTHNGERFIVEQLESMFAQSVLPDEIVLSDDASTDGTLEIARDALSRLSEASSKPPAIVVLANTSPLGVTANFSKAIDQCSGDVILLSDQDDRWANDRLERTRAAFAARPELLLLHGDARLIDESDRDLGTTLFEALEIGPEDLRQIHDGEAFTLLLRRNLVTGATTAIRASLATTAMPFPAAWVHDEWLAIVASAVGVVDVIEIPLIDYRQHGSNQIGVSKLGLFGKFGRMREPGGARNARLLARAEELQARFESMGTAIPAGKSALVVEKLVHETARTALPVNRLRRLPGVLAELRSGRYQLFGRGRLDAARDLIQPRHGAG